MAEKTRAQLEAEIDVLKAQISARDEENARLNDLAEALKESNVDAGGWIVTTPNPLYQGVFLGVLFKNGRAWVSRKMKDAELIVRKFEHDFHYNIEEKGAKELSSFKSEWELEELVVPEGPSQSMLDTVSPPAIFGGGGAAPVR